MAYTTPEYHPAFEEYCEAIFELAEDDVDVIQARIAERLEVSRPAVSEMIRKMEREGFIKNKDGQIVLNISPTAVMDLNISNDALAFNGRFGGVATDIFVPVNAVIGIYARENGQGMVFEPEQVGDEPPPEDEPPEPPKPEGRPSLKIVK